MDLEQAFRVRPSTGSFIKKNSITWTPASCTGIPNKYYRGSQQVLPGSPTSIFVRWPTACDDNPHKHAEVRPCLTLQGPFEGLPGSPTSATGVPNKPYRGPQQKLPGSPTNITGAPNKPYRGPQQILPGRPTSRPCETCCKMVYFGLAFGVPLFLFLL
jgi:hypothetical protein